MSKKRVREAYDRLLAAAAALQPDVAPPEHPDDLPDAIVLEFASFNCSMWGTTVNKLLEQRETVDQQRLATAVTMLRLSCECYLAAFHEMAGTFAEGVLRELS